MKLEMKKTILLSVKIGIGASSAIYIAQLLNLQYATSAGIITLLTLITTRWGTFRLSVQRLITYGVSAALCWFVFLLIPSVWIEYGLFLFVLVLLTESLGWRSTLSVNAVIGTHFFTTQDFTWEFLLNELLLVVIGITIAVLLNLFHMNQAHEHGIVRRMRRVEASMQQILLEMSSYLNRAEMGERVWEDLVALDRELDECLELAYEYNHNTFQNHQNYYIDYFEMRMKQCVVLRNLHSEMIRMREMTKQAKIVADFMIDMAQYVTEMNDPQKQVDDLERLLVELRNEPLPKTHQEFESRAELYHVLMDLEEFILYKKRFIEMINETQFRIYWQKRILP